MNFIKSPKMIKLYTCSEQKKFTEIGKKSEYILLPMQLIILDLQSIKIHHIIKCLMMPLIWLIRMLALKK